MRKKLKELREERNLSVKEAAEFLGISESHYYKIESGLRSPNFKLAGEFAKFFGTNVDELFFGNELDESSKKRVAI
ncbi:helix-turn-helix transcriptional regulator [Planococcus sp. YIM B11945]|uniref:helix-turn-helix transcriptional regulator n=1 Tax=Planococcus sp. YIM B11945 TaxID=3435410 RepID=UPI003D7F16AF